MPRMNVTGLEEFSSRIYALKEGGVSLMKAAIYDGAGVMVEAVKEEIMKLPEESGYMKDGQRRTVIKKSEKQALIDHIGIAKIDNIGGKVSTAIGFDGYSDLITNEHPNGVPVALIARSIESGSSVRQKRPFMRTAGKAAKERVQQAMIEAANQKIQELTKE